VAIDLTTVDQIPVSLPDEREGQRIIARKVNDLLGGRASTIMFGVTSKAQLGVWGATPISQPTTASSSATFVSGTGSGVTIDATFDGYTIGQTVKALRDLGVLE